MFPVFYFLIYYVEKRIHTITNGVWRVFHNENSPNEIFLIGLKDLWREWVGPKVAFLKQTSKHNVTSEVDLLAGGGGGRWSLWGLRQGVGRVASWRLPQPCHQVGHGLQRRSHRVVALTVDRVQRCQVAGERVQAARVLLAVAHVAPDAVPCTQQENTITDLSG